MEDSITENEKLQVLTSMEHKEGGAKEVIFNGEDVVQDKPTVGFINQMISNFTPAAETGEKHISKQERNDHVEEKPIGLINHIISSFAPGDKEQEEEELDNKQEKQEDNKEGGGLFSHIMSNLVSSPVSSPDAKTPEKDGNGLFVSNLPPPLPGTNFILPSHPP